MTDGTLEQQLESYGKVNMVSLFSLQQATFGTVRLKSWRMGSFANIKYGPYPIYALSIGYYVPIPIAHVL